ncbi:SWIM zinc finger protein [Neorhizobium sp. JUb45]|nr:SWIM zinc finger protein [Neorhizobium sp. JUb45]
MDTSVMFDATPLSDEVLEAASSRGLLRRARRDVEAGLVRITGRDGGTILTEADGETVQLPAGPLSAARCSCPASGLCRHILASIVFIREAEEVNASPAAEEEITHTQVGPGEPLSSAPVVAAAENEPGEPDPKPDIPAEIRALGDATIVKAFGRAAHIRAQALIAALEPNDIRMEANGNTLRIELGTHPVVHYLAGGGPAGMISKSTSSERMVLHAAALVAVLGPANDRKADDPTEVASDVAPGLGAAVSADSLADATLLLRHAARLALSKAPIGLEERTADLTLSSRAESIPRLAAELRTIAAMIRRRRERLDGAEPADLLRMLARSYALIEALKTRPSDPLLSGFGGEAPQKRAAIDLVGCGLQLWQTDSGARGVTGYYISAEGENFNATLARGAGSDTSFSPSGAATGDPVFGHSLAALAGRAFRLDGGAATSTGRLQVGGGRAHVDDRGWAASIGAIDGAVLDDWQQCAARLVANFRPKLAMTPRRAVPLVLKPTRLGALRFDEVSQVGYWPIGDMHGAWLELEIDGDDRMDAKFELLGALDARKPPLIVVLAEERGAEILMTPLGFGSDALTLLDLPPIADRPPEQKASLLSRLAKGLSFSGTSRHGGDDSLRFEAMSLPRAKSMRLVSGAFDGLLALAELGGRMEDADRLQAMEQSGQAMEEAGLMLAGRLVANVATAPSAERPDRLLRAAYALDLLTRTEPRLPFVRPLP